MDYSLWILLGKYHHISIQLLSSVNPPAYYCRNSHQSFSKILNFRIVSYRLNTLMQIFYINFPCFPYFQNCILFGVSILCIELFNLNYLNTKWMRKPMILNSEYKILKQFIFMILSTQMIFFASTLFVLPQFMNQYWIKTKLDFCGESFEQCN